MWRISWTPRTTRVRQYASIETNWTEWLQWWNYQLLMEIDTHLYLNCQCFWTSLWRWLWSCVVGVREEKERVQVSSSGMLWASALVTTLAGFNSSWTDANEHKLNIQTANELNNWTTKELNDANGNSLGPTSRLSCPPPTDTCQRVPQRRERSQSKAWLWPWCQTAQPQFPCFIQREKAREFLLSHQCTS